MNKGKLFFSAGLLTALFGLGVFTLVKTPRTFSEQENRVLTTLPKEISVSDIDSGKFQKDLSDTLSDQFPGRDQVLSATTVIRKTMGARDLNGAYLGRDGYYFEKVTDSDIDRRGYRNNLDRIERIAEEFPEISFSMLPVPSSGVILKDKLPAGAEIYDADVLYQEAKERMPKVRVADPREALTAAADSEQIYYRTDHHWTTAGAEIGYRVWKEQNHLSEEEEGSFAQTDNKESAEQGQEKTDSKVRAYERIRVSETFLGSLYSKTLDPSRIPDPIEAACPEGTDPKEWSLETLKVTTAGEPSAMYQYDKLTEKDQYQFFFGGNFGEIRIETGNGKGTIVVLKDSFANCFVPYLLSDYGTVIMIDPRYYPGAFRKLLNEEQPEEVLILYELNNFANDTNQAKLSL